MEALELPRTLPAGWTQAVSKTGKPYFVNAETRTTRWEWPEETLPPFRLLSRVCADKTCLLDADVRARAAAAAWLKSSMVRELVTSAVRTVLDLGCGDAAYCASLPKRAQLHGWDMCPEGLRAARATFPKGQFRTVDMCAAGEVLPAQAPAAACDLVLCLDAAQHAFGDAASARRWARRVRALLAPSGAALLLIPRAQALVDRTGNGCIEFLSRGRVVCKAVGSAWPPNVLDIPVYGAGYCEYVPAHAPGAPATFSQSTRTQWLVTLPSLEHACAATDLAVLGSCTAAAFLRWCGIGQCAYTPEAQARRDRAYASWLAEMGAPASACVAQTWEELQLYTLAVLSPIDAPAGSTDPWKAWFAACAVLEHGV